MDSIIGQLNTLWDEASAIWISGGWAMIAIATIALVMFAMGTHIHFKLKNTGFQSVSEKTWRRWIDRPAERKGPIGALLDFVTGGTSINDTKVRCEQVRTTETTPFERDLRVMKICVSAAPLVGLLGTVTGMLATFGALATGSGGDKTMGLVASGISEALITTETGLVIALPGLFFQYQLSRRYQRYKAFLAHLENACTQNLYRKIRERRQRMLERAALKDTAPTLEEHRLSMKKAVS
jgi:biopolymer transport protein ExbB